MEITDEERRHGRLHPATVEVAVAEFKELGHVVLRRCLPMDFTAVLRRAYLDELERYRRWYNVGAAGERDPRRLANNSVAEPFRPEGGNIDHNRWAMYLPSAPPFLDERVVANPFALEILRGLLGTGLSLPMVRSDTPLPGAAFQCVHQDSAHFRIMMNIALLDVGERSAPLEVWPRTHREGLTAPFSLAPLPLRRAEIAHYRDRIPSQRLLLPAGSVVLRDHRLVHRGTSNHSDQPRAMLTLLYQAGPDAAPHQSASRAALRTAQYFKGLGRGHGRGVVRPRTLDAAALLQLDVEQRAGSDRHGSRVIPPALWEALPPSAQRLLRFASVGGPGGAPGVARSWRASASLAVHTLDATWAMARAAFSECGFEVPLLQRSWQRLRE